MREIYINAPTKKVWQAFVEPNQFFMSFFGADIRSSFQIGEKIEYSGVYKATKQFIFKYLILALNWYTLKSRVKVIFSEIGESTQISLTNDQFSENNPMKDEAKQLYLILSNLKTCIETGNLMNIPNQQ